MNRRRIFLVFVFVCLATAILQITVSLLGAQSAARDLRAAQTALRSQQFPEANAHLVAAVRALRRSRAVLSNANPLLLIASYTPYVRVQLLAGRDLLAAGERVAGAGLAALPVASELSNDGSLNRDRRAVVERVARSKATLAGALAEIVRAQADVQDIARRPLLPVLRQQVDLGGAQLAAARIEATRANAGLTAFLAIFGADGPSRFLLLSQNPDEPRPGGGFIGTYGVLTGDRGDVHLPVYGSTFTWKRSHLRALIPNRDAPAAFRVTSGRISQSLENVNTTPDWPTSARLAARLWEIGGDSPLNGVMTFRPQLLFGLTKALGGITVPGYAERVTAENVDGLLEKYTHSEAAFRKDEDSRKGFIAALAKSIFSAALTARGGSLVDISKSIGHSLDVGDLQIWLKEPTSQAALHDAHWDGALPETSGDFFADSTFCYATKNGRDIKRIYRHSVHLYADGTGLSETEVTIRNEAPYHPLLNPSGQMYLTPYGPQGGQLTQPSDNPVGPEPSLAGHPSAGWPRIAPPLGLTHLRVTWAAPGLLTMDAKGDTLYRLTFLPAAGHTGDRLELRVEPPRGFHWVGLGPPLDVGLDAPFSGVWRLERD